MKKTDILYLRDNRDLDETLQKITDSLDTEINLTFESPDFLKSDTIEKEHHKLVIYRGDLPESEITDKVRMGTFSIIFITSSDNCSQNFHSNWNSFVEKVPERMIKEFPGCFADLLNKNLYLRRNHVESHNILRKLFPLLNDGVCIFNRDGKIIETNGKITGIPAEKLIGCDIYDFFSEANKTTVAKHMKKSFESGDKLNFELKVSTDEGEIPVKINAMLVRDDQKAPLYYVAVLTDIRAEKSAWVRKQLINNVVETSRDGIIAIDKSGRIILWNSGAGELFGYSGFEILGKSLTVLEPKRSNLENIDDLISKVREKGFLKNLIFDCRKKNGKTVKVEFTLTMMDDEQGNFIGVSIVARDLTRMRKDLDKARKKNEEMEHLINVVSHDLRSPLHSVDNYISFIQESIKGKVEDEEVFEMLERTHANLSNMEELISDLTDFSRAGLEPGEDVAVDLNSIVDDITINLQWQVGRKNLLIKCKKLPTLRINLGRIQRIFENLISNAWKFRKEEEPASVEIWTEENEDGMITFCVKDSGIGISHKHQQRIFNLFFRSKEKVVEGTGAGLAVTRKIINNYKGEIWVESEPGKGSCFKFTLPISMKVED